MSTPWCKTSWWQIDKEALNITSSRVDLHQVDKEKKKADKVSHFTWNPPLSFAESGVKAVAKEAEAVKEKATETVNSYLNEAFKKKKAGALQMKVVDNMEKRLKLLGEMWDLRISYKRKI